MKYGFGRRDSHSSNTPTVMEEFRAELALKEVCVAQLFLRCTLKESYAPNQTLMDMDVIRLYSANSNRGNEAFER